MPMPIKRDRLGADITKESALNVIRERHERHPDVAPEITAMSLMRCVDSWEEHSAIIAALDTFNAQQKT